MLTPFFGHLDTKRGLFPNPLYRMSIEKFPEKRVQCVQVSNFLGTILPVLPLSLSKVSQKSGSTASTRDKAPVPLPPGARTLKGEPYYLEDEKSPGGEDSHD
jgi:hypothetical protein